MQNLPSLTRNPYDFRCTRGKHQRRRPQPMYEQPATRHRWRSELTSFRGAGFNINGQRPSDTELLLDGAENLNIFDNTIALLIPQDAVQEFRVITNNFDAQYGRAAGGIVNVLDQIRNQRFPRRRLGIQSPFCVHCQHVRQQCQRHSEGPIHAKSVRGGRGGPIKKDKLFFYASTELLRVRSAASLLALCPRSGLLKDCTSPAVQSWFAKFVWPSDPCASECFAKGDPALQVQHGRSRSTRPFQQARRLLIS